MSSADQNISPQKAIIVGRLGAPFGVKGWVKVNSFTEPFENIFRYQPWLLSADEKTWHSVKFEACKQQGNGLIVKFADCNDRDAAKLLTHQVVAISSEQLPPAAENEYYWADLEGLTVITKNNDVLGKVDRIMSTGANDVLVVCGEKEYLIPFVQQHYILSVDLAAQTITVDWDPEY